MLTSFECRYAGSLAWLNFRGDWGNAKSGCDFEAVSGECKMNHGPTFPGGPDDIPPPRIQRSRQSAPAPSPPVANRYPASPSAPRYSPRLNRFRRANGTSSELVNPAGANSAPRSAAD